MRFRIADFGLRIVLFAALLCAAAVVSAQKPPQKHPDLQGLWTNGTLTPLVRPADLGDKARFTAEEAAAWEKGGLDRVIKTIGP